MERDDLVKESSRSWIVAACCCFCNLTFYGLSRLSGIMLVATTQTFHVSRASAAIPFSLGTAIRNLAGVFVGHLGHRFGVAPVVATGCFIAFLGSGLCFLAQDVLWLAVCWGGIFGFGFGLCTCLLPLAINQNFSKHLGTASGISYSGSYIGSFVFPPVVVWLLDSFGLQGTFLIISGGVLHVLVAALLLKEPRRGGKAGSIDKSPQDALSVIDSENLRKCALVQPYCLEVGELRRRNIQRAYLALEANRLGENKQHFRHSISFENNLRCPADRTNGRRFSENGNVSETLCTINDILRSEINTCRHNLLPKLFETSESTYPRNDKASESQNVSLLKHVTSDFSSTSDTDSVHSGKWSDARPAGDVHSADASAKQASVIQRGCLKKPPESKSFFRGNLKAKYKLKLQKLKKALVASLLKPKSPYLKEFVLAENVRLTSFRYLQPFLRPKASSVCETTTCSHLSSPRDILGGNGTIVRVGSCSTNSAVSLKHNKNRSGRCHSLPMFELNGQPALLPVVSGSLFDRAKVFAISEGKRLEQKTIERSQSASKDQDRLFPPRSSNGGVIPYNTCYDALGDEHSRYPCDVLSLSPELLLKPKTEFKAHKRKVSSGSQSKPSGPGSCFLEWLHMFRKPMFVIIGATMSIQTFIVVCVVTTIEDYARDLGIPENRTHYALMALSIANLVGTLTLGSITDRGLISRHRFMFLCFLGMFLSLVALSLFAVSLPSLLSLIVIYGLLESGVIITFPLLTKQFVEGQRRQAVAIASSNVLSVPTVMLVPMLIGHFRDNIGSYAGLFQLLGATSLTCSLLWLVAPSICKRRKLKRKALQLNTEKC